MYRTSREAPSQARPPAGAVALSYFLPFPLPYSFPPFSFLPFRERFEEGGRTGI